MQIEKKTMKKKTALYFGNIEILVDKSCASVCVCACVYLKSICDVYTHTHADILFKSENMKFYFPHKHRAMCSKIFICSSKFARCCAVHWCAHMKNVYTFNKIHTHTHTHLELTAAHICVIIYIYANIITC